MRLDRMLGCFWVSWGLALLEHHFKIRILRFVNYVSKLLVRLVIFWEGGVWEDFSRLWFFVSNIGIFWSTDEGLLKARYSFAWLLVLFGMHFGLLLWRRPAWAIRKLLLSSRSRRFNLVEVSWRTAWIMVACSALLTTVLLCYSLTFWLPWSQLIIIMSHELSCLKFLNRIFLVRKLGRWWDLRSLSRPIGHFACLFVSWCMVGVHLWWFGGDFGRFGSNLVRRQGIFF